MVCLVFFSSRRRHTRYIGDWSSDVCSSDLFYSQGRSEELVGEFVQGRRHSLVLSTKYSFATRPGDPNSGGNHRKSLMRALRSEERRVGKECRSQRGPTYTTIKGEQAVE